MATDPFLMKIITFAVRFEELHSFNKAQRFVNRSADWKVVDRFLANFSFWIDNKGTAQSNAGIFN